METSERFLPLEMDLAVPESIGTAIKAAQSHFGRIDVLVNNAGVGYLAAIEEGEDEKVRALFETNVFSVASTIRAALPGMRARGSGTIINVSSNSGIVAVPALGYYSASKFALEGLTEALWQEVQPFGIHAMLIEPGGMRTGIVGRNLRSPRLEGYDTTAHAVIDMLLNDTGVLAPSDPRKIAKILMDLVGTGEMPRRLLLGPDSWEGVMGKIENQLDEYKAWKQVSFSTRFDEEVS